MRRLLVANRGEIALRIFRACRAEGIETVAVAAPDDRAALHAESADALVEISSYLEPAEHVRAAQESGADAVNPGYGFLCESPELAEAVLEAGLIWVGAPGGRRHAHGEGDRARGRCPRLTERDTRGDRLPAARQGGRGRRRARHARRARARGLGGGARSGAPRGGCRVRRRLGLLRALSRAAPPRRDPAPRRPARQRRGARRARLLDPAPPPEG